MKKLTAVVIMASALLRACQGHADFERALPGDRYGSKSTISRLSRRNLQQADDQIFVAVATPDDLKEALQRGVQDIVITAHLDLTDLPLIETDVCGSGCASPLPEIRGKTRSIRGNCSSPLTEADVTVLNTTPGAADLVPLQPQQCLILSYADTLVLKVARVWIDNIYLRAVFVNSPEDIRRNDTSIGLVSVPSISDGVSYTEPGEAQRYITRTTLQGDGLGPTVALWPSEDTYVENCTFVNLGGAGLSGGCEDCSSAINVNGGASIAIINSTFYDITPGEFTRYVRSWDNDTAVLITGCEFANATQPFEARDGSLFYSDNTALVIETDTTRSPALSIDKIPEEEEPPVFLSRKDEWIQMVMEELIGREALPPQPAPPAPPPVARLPQVAGGDSSLPTGTVVAIAVSVAIFLIFVALICLYRVHRARRLRYTKSTFAHPGGLNTEVAYDGFTDVSGPPKHLSMHSMQPSIVLSNSSSRAGSRSTRTLTTYDNTFAGTVGAMTCATTVTHLDSSEPPKDAPVSAKLEFLHTQLNSIGKDSVVLERFVLLGPMQRRQGGQGVVAFARGVHGDLGYAMKFFVQRSSFLAERETYQSHTLGRLLPKVHAEYDPEELPEALMDAWGRPLPPCLVMERGEGLSDWSQRAKPDIFQTVAVLAHVAMRLRDMHEAGYVHRDIKPENIMLLHRENVWTVIDFGCTARAGEAAPLSYTLVYAAPEVAEAAATGQKTIVADPAMDAWSLGVVAFELLTRQSAFNLLIEGRDSVVAKLRGQAELPWEGDLTVKNPEVRKRLGVFREPVLSLLRRDPAQRSSLETFCKTTNNVFSSPTTIAASEKLRVEAVLKGTA